ncbi:MAG: NTP transferase domain-containing protein [Oscillospiraceae bacterium]|nr:NTP transferase domain-containing protein [Oscillospiraceae bacterium]
MKAIILAAGKGKRLNSEITHIPKAMRTALGRPLIEYVLDTIGFIDINDIVIVVGFEKDQIINSLPDYSFAVQSEQLGTGHAALCAKDFFADYDGDILVIAGDTPLILRSTAEKLLEFHQENNNACTVLSCMGEKGLSLGRIMRDKNGNLSEIVENRDCTSEQLEICEYNTATYIFKSKLLFPALEKIMRNNQKHEVYLTDVPAVLLNEGEKVGAVTCEHEFEIFGVNTEADLYRVEGVLKSRLSTNSYKN